MSEVSRRTTRRENIYLLNYNFVIASFKILLYKAHQCVGKLNEAHENVQTEMRKLEQNSDHAFEDINRTFQEIINVVDRRRQELLGYAKKMREDKRSILQDQLTLIETEREKVETECTGRFLNRLIALLFLSFSEKLTLNYLSYKF